MMPTTPHLSDSDLLRFCDGEASEKELQQMIAHLAACDICCDRQTQFVVASSHFADLQRMDASSSASQEANARASLEAHMASASRPPSGAWYRSVSAAIAAVLCIAVLTSWHRARTVTSSHARVSLAPSVPDIDLTPGDVRPVRLEDVCETGDDDLDPAVPASIQKAVFHEYGVDAGASEGFQIDYLVSPQLGGTDSIQNLWPEPYGTTVWNARAKDALEQRLRGMVCTGQIDLAAAQREIRVDWIAAYKKYFNSPRPL